MFCKVRLIRDEIVVEEALRFFCSWSHCLHERLLAFFSSEVEEEVLLSSKNLVVSTVAVIRQKKASKIYITSLSLSRSCNHDYSFKINFFGLNAKPLNASGGQKRGPTFLLETSIGNGFIHIAILDMTPLKLLL